MEKNEFAIGTEFILGDGRFRCTDVGTRVVVAIRIDEVDRTTTALDAVGVTESLSGEAAAAQGWFTGPPYAVLEHVIDEYELEACERA